MDIYDLNHVKNKMKLSNRELFEISGGFSLSGTLINSLSKAASYIYEFGRTIGSTIRYLKSGRTCKF